MIILFSLWIFNASRIKKGKRERQRAIKMNNRFYQIENHWTFSISLCIVYLCIWACDSCCVLIPIYRPKKKEKWKTSAHVHTFIIQQTKLSQMCTWVGVQFCVYNIICNELAGYLIVCARLTISNEMQCILNENNN